MSSRSGTHGVSSCVCASLTGDEEFPSRIWSFLLTAFHEDVGFVILIHRLEGGNPCLWLSLTFH